MIIQRLNATQTRFRELARRFWWLTVVAWISWEVVLDRGAGWVNDQLDRWSIPAAGLLSEMIAPLGLLATLMAALIAHAYFDTRADQAVRKLEAKKLAKPGDSATQQETTAFILHDGVQWELENGQVEAGPFCPHDYTDLVYEDINGRRQPLAANVPIGPASGRLMCPDCGRASQLGGQNKTILESSREVETIYAAALRRARIASLGSPATSATASQASGSPPVELDASSQESTAKPDQHFTAGDHVRHRRFGEGIVVNAVLTANGADQEVTVAFKGESGVKKLLLSFAPLEKLD